MLVAHAALRISGAALTLSCEYDHAIMFSARLKVHATVLPYIQIVSQSSWSLC
jgi:hypothetical protein